MLYTTNEREQNMTSALTLTHPGDSLAAIRQALESDSTIQSAHTRRAYFSDLSQFENWRGGRTLTKNLVSAYASKMSQENRSPNSINRALCAVRWYVRKFADMAQEQNELTKAQRDEIAETAQRVASIKSVTGSRGVRGRHLESGERQALIDVCVRDESAAGIRDGAILSLMMMTGLRRDEAASLTLSSLKPIESDFEITIKGKRNKVRTLWVFNGAAQALSDWLALRGPEPGALWRAINKGGRIVPGSSLNAKAVARIVERRGLEAGIETNAHDLRRTFAGTLLDSGSDLSLVSKLMGHASVNTTALYDRRPDSAKRQALRALHVGYKRRSAK